MERLTRYAELVALCRGSLPMHDSVVTTKEMVR